ncbi:Alpha/Beta hydrolase protein [Schizophyllum fasciatum]
MLGESLYLFALVWLYITGSPPGSESEPIVDLGYAKYRGNRTYENVVSYLGLPYAQPPVGDLRFRAPVPLDYGADGRASAKDEVIDATEYPDFCIQGTTGSGDAGGAGSEDCLKVNVYTPKDAREGDKLPVLFYIHGGGYTYGNPAAFSLAHWVHQSPNVIIVSVYYRLGVFGFLAAPEFHDDKVLGDLNAGFLDQRLALIWVQNHISRFGGDPAKVTINGESAGGSSIELHLIANDEQGLFRAAIAQSIYRTPLPTPDEQRPLFYSFTMRVGCSHGNIAEQMACLRRADVSALARAQDATSASIDIWYKWFHPVIDYALFVDYPTQLIRLGAAARIPLIVGSTSNETLAAGHTVEDALSEFFPSMTRWDLADLLEHYHMDDFTSHDEYELTVTGESSIRCARTILAEAFSRNRRAWTYRYNQPNPSSGSDTVGHAAENWMMFQGVNTGPNGTFTSDDMDDTQKAFAQELIAYWLSFVRSGDPNAHKLDRSPDWLEYSTHERSRLVLQESPIESSLSGSAVEEESEDETGRCAAIADLARSQQA